MEAVEANAAQAWKIGLLNLIDNAIKSHPWVAPTLNALKNNILGASAPLPPNVILGIITAIISILGMLPSGLLPIPANLKPLIDGFVTQINTLLAAVPPPLGPLPPLPLP